MSSRTNIDPLSITDGKISNQAKINPKKIAHADEASLLIAQRDRKYQPKTIYGDGTIDADGKLTITSTPAPATTIVEEELLPEDSVRIGPSSTDNTKKNSTKKVGSGAGAIPTRDSSGNLKAETADQATNADNATNSTKLNNQEGSFYTDVANHTGQAAAYEYEATSQSNVSQSPSTFTHNLGYIPDVIVYQSDGETLPSFSEIDAEVKSTTTTTDVTVSEGGVSMKVIIK